ncbi:MAG TPA: bifunctional oligoribonuclease/PAP phosphatase NrnA [Patescibacteria group bacterium]|nr:bifunctional oligoribonuclease/PAP phosphatase NrnA [Patescibacteria group bacterium]
MEFNLIAQKIVWQVNSANNIILVTHQQPDADALGSLSAMSQWLNDLGKKHLKFCLDQPPNNLEWLLDFQPLTTDFSEVLKQDFDLAIVLDSGDLKYAGVESIFSKLKQKPFLINIDHHQTNQNFGDLNLVDKSASSTTEVIYHFFKAIDFSLTPKIGNALLAGLVGDTYNFTNPNTTKKSLAAVSDLMNDGALLPRVVTSVLKNKTLETLQVWGKALARLNFNSDFQMVSTIVTQDDLPAGLPLAEATDGVANLLNNIGGIKAALVLQQESNGVIKGSLRTNDDLIDVSLLAKILGGGGHRKAAGFKIKGKLVQEKNGQWQIV